MLIWLNGPFGGGKTQVAHELARRLEDSVICDPEEVGFGLHRTLPPSLRGDFQDLESWRRGVVETLDLALRRGPGAVIAPMTVVEPAYFDETVGKLRDLGHDVCHVALLAERDVVLRRLRERAFGRVLRRVAPGPFVARRTSFAESKLDLCLERLVDERFATRIDTDHIGIPEVAERVAALAGFTLAPNTESELRGRLRRGVVGVRHIRLL